MSRLTLALDAMGGDFGPRVTIPASIKALENDPMLSLLLFGESHQIIPFFENISPTLRQRITLCHCTHKVENAYKLSYAIKHSKGTSMRLAIEAVQKGLAQGCVSGGSTAVLMGLSKILLQPLDGIYRPALLSLIPTVNGSQSVMLDLGANIECCAENLYQFALMGSIFAQNQLGLVYPRIALLNIGIEKVKGHKTLHDVADLLQNQTELNYTGFIEGSRLLNGDVDVIVSDGFTGNIALKTLEGTVRNMSSLFRFNSSRQHKKFSRLDHLLDVMVKRYLSYKIHSQTETFCPENYNGAALIGLRSVVVKSHGGAGQQGFYNAISFASRQVRQGIPDKILTGLDKMKSNLVKEIDK